MIVMPKQQIYTAQLFKDIKADVIFEWDFLIIDNLIFIMHGGACSLFVFKFIKNREKPKSIMYN